MGKYHKPTSCNHCGGTNDINVTDSLDDHMSECKTKCRDCGEEDYWAYGFFESSCNIIGKCEKY